MGIMKVSLLPHLRGVQEPRMPRKPAEGLSFEELQRELQAYLAEIAGDSEVTRLMRRLQALQDLELTGELSGITLDTTPSEPSPRTASPQPLIVPPKDDMQRARSVVNRLLPSQPPNVPGLDIAVYTRSCHEVGGDYFDFITLPEGRVAFAIADVAGKGFSAAILMAMLREVLRIVAANDPVPARAVAATNRLLVPDMPRGMFVTLLYGVIVPSTREMTLVNAGHCPPIIWRPRLTGARVLDLRGPAVGVLDPQRFAEGLRQRSLQLEPGDCLCFFTDGVTEATDLLGEEFGQQRLAQVIRNHATEPAAEIVKAITEAVNDHTKGAAQHDDMTLIVLRALPTTSPKPPKQQP